MPNEALSSFNRASPGLLQTPAPPGDTEGPKEELGYPEGFTFKDLQEKTKNLADQWKGNIEKVKKNRLLRNMEVDNEAERSRGRFKPDEIYIPIHVINDNINKEFPAAIGFISGSRNAGIFKPKNIGDIFNFSEWERIFTSYVRYDGWLQEVFSVLDGSALHGVDYLEVKYDDTKPGFFSFEQLGYENVWYPLNVARSKLQASPILIRNCEVTKEELMNFPGVNVEQVELLFKDSIKNDPKKEYQCVQKVSYRLQGKVYICWMAYDKSTDFIRNPQPLHLGRWNIVRGEMGEEISREKIYESFYPVVPWPYSITENKILAETKGRVCFDESTQEAASSIVSSIVNGFHRASQTMWAPKNPTSTGEIEQLDIVLEGGRGVNQPIDFFNPPYPDESGMNLVNALLTQNKSETSQINFAVGNRSDYASRKTAKEVGVAEKKETELSTTKVILISAAWKETLTIGFLICKAQIELGIIKVSPEISQMLSTVEMELLAAGETEVIQRQETLTNLQNLWPILETTPAAIPVLQDILRLMVPSSADKYIAALNQMPDKMLVQGLATIISAIAQQHPEVIPPESYEELGALLKQAQSSLEGNSGEMPGTSQDNKPKGAPPKNASKPQETPSMKMEIPMNPANQI